VLSRRLRAVYRSLAAEEANGAGAPRSDAPSLFLVGLGQTDGGCGADANSGDPVNCLLEQGLEVHGQQLTFNGLALEGDSDYRPQLERSARERWKGEVTVGLGFLTPQEFAEQVRVAASAVFEASAGASIDLLKIDVDHADCLFLLQALRALAAARLPLPKVLTAEFLPSFPPPVRFVERFQPVHLEDFRNAKFGDFWAGLGGRAALRGCSLQAFSDVTERFGYRITDVTTGDVVMVRRDVLAPSSSVPLDLLRAWAREALCRPPFLFSLVRSAALWDPRSMLGECGEVLPSAGEGYVLRCDDAWMGAMP